MYALAYTLFLVILNDFLNTINFRNQLLSIRKRFFLVRMSVPLAIREVSSYSVKCPLFPYKFLYYLRSNCSTSTGKVLPKNQHQGECRPNLQPSWEVDSN